MKKVFFGLVFLCLTHAMAAQDVIITTDAKKIESTILEVSKTEIKYKEFANPNGPTFVLSTDEISSIIYANGQVQLFSSSPRPASNDITPEQASADNTNKGRIFRDNNEYMYNDTYISSKEVERILKKENSAAYAKWRQGKGMLIGGSVCSGIGCGLILSSLCFLGRETPIPTLSMDGAGLVMAGVGLGLVLGANSCYNKAIDIYNSTYDQTSMRLNFFAGYNGVGLALNF